MKIEQHNLFVLKEQKKNVTPAQKAAVRSRPELNLKLGLNKSALKDEGMLILRMLQNTAQTPQKLLYIMGQEIKIKKGITTPELALMETLLKQYAPKS